MMQEKTHRQIKEMRHLLGDYVRFRVWFDWFSGKRRHLLGQEWGAVTLAQLMNRRVPQIKLDREAGYKDCLGMCEKFHGRYRTAKIFSGYAGQFEKVHRIYTCDDKEPQDINDPLINESNRFLILDYEFDGAFWTLTKAKNNLTEEVAAIDFKKELQDHLEPTIPHVKTKVKRTKKVKADIVI